MVCASPAAKALLALGAACGLLRPTAAQLSWPAVLNPFTQQQGDGTYYGQQGNQDAAGACSYSSNFANTNGMPWSSGAAASVALNDAQWANGEACGMCIEFRGTGAGIGTKPIPGQWQRGFVNNRCPECAFGSVDVNMNGDGRWKIEWHAVPCSVGTSKMQYNIVVSSYYWFSLVVSNTRVPVKNVTVKINGNWVPMKRSSNNQWPYYNTNGPWQSSFPMPIRITSVAGETVEDVLTSQTVTKGKVQFGTAGFSSDVPSSSSAQAPGQAPSGGSPPASPAPGPASSAASSSSSSSSSGNSSPSIAPSQSGSGSSGPSSSSSGGAKFFIDDYAQCGGSVSACDNEGAPCINAPWPNAACKSAGWTCNAYSAQFYQCQPPGYKRSGSSGSQDIATAGRRLLASSRSP